jgi:plastocyanin domain-containing protein
LWFQVQRRGKVETTSWVLRVSAPDYAPSDIAPPDGPTIRISSAGFEPQRISIPADQPARIWVTRADAQNCASEIVFPELQIRKPLPPGESVAIDLPATPSGELHFACGMGMFRGAVVVR